MHMTRLLKLLVLLGWGYLPAVQALDLIQIYEMAAENDPQVRQVREQLNSARESKPQAKALLLPTLSLGGGYDLVHQDTRSSAFGVTGTENYDQYDIGLQVNQPVYHRDYWIRLEQADDTIAQAEAQLSAAEIDLMVRSAVAYFNVLSAADDLRTATAEKEANARQLEQAQQRFEVGLIAITDVHESQAAYDGSVASEITAKNALANAWEALQEIVGPIRQSIARLGPDLNLVPPTPEDEEQWAKTALEQNFGIMAAQQAAELAKKNIEVQRSGHYPTVDLVGSYGRSESGSDFGTDRDTGIIGLQLAVPLYTGGAVDSRTRQARYDYQAAMEGLDQQRRSVNRQVRDAYRGVISTMSRVKALESTVVSFQSALESTQAGLEVGTRTMVDVLTVTRNLYDAQRNYSRSRYDYIVNGLLLHQAASTLDRELLQKANTWLLQDDQLNPPS
jgi:outer membrane protein